jgi:hypothetical protein
VQVRKIPVRLRLQIGEHLPIVSFDLGEKSIYSRKHSHYNVEHLEPQGVEFAPQPLYIPLPLFTVTAEIAHLGLSYFVQELLKQLAQVQRRSPAAIAHDRRDGVAYAVNVPRDNRPGVFSRRAGNAGRTPIAPRAFLAGDTALSRRSQ